MLNSGKKIPNVKFWKKNYLMLNSGKKLPNVKFWKKIT
jgi:hypothetical protein